MTPAPQPASKSFIRKILPATYSSPRITLNFSPKPLIPVIQGGGGCRTSPSFWKHAILLVTLAFAVIFSTRLAVAQAQRGTLVHEATIRVSPSADAAKLGEAGRGHELVIIETSRDW